jgi:cyclophilin family peptidyl-prolyl cis-trans isomerase
LRLSLQAVENFLAFCKGVDVGGKALGYVGCPFTRVVKRFVVQAGDVVNKDGTGERDRESVCIDTQGEGK